ncbi:MAG: membrane protein insertion efficiency factor YidD [Planctomycetia bacterium]
METPTREEAPAERRVGWPERLGVALIRQYQYWLSPFFRGCCRFHPSCSEYCLRAIVKYGLVVGCWKGFWRICRCNPFHPGGVDDP